MFVSLMAADTSSSAFAPFNQTDSNYQKLMQIPTDIYQRLAGILLIFAVIMSIVTIIFLMYTRNDKNVSMFKQALKKILITVVIFLMLGTIYSYLMMIAEKHSWDSSASIQGSPASDDSAGDIT